MKLEDIQIRDPYVVPVPDEGAYFLFGSTDPNVWDGPGIGFDCFRSTDLVEWVGPIPAFRPPRGFWSPGSYWAPEVHRVDDHWYLFGTFTGYDGSRGTAVLRSSRVDGPYEPWSDGAITPDGWHCLDGTLFADDAGSPWMVFCHEFIDCGDGEIRAIRLTPDLRAADGDSHLLFRASEAPWARQFEGTDELVAVPPPHHVTDGPFLHRTTDGHLLMLWSSFGDQGYAMGIARSTTGSLLGPWKQDDDPIWSADGGHGMLFRTFDGGLHLTLHQPNQTPEERAVIRAVDEPSMTIVGTRLHRDVGGQSRSRPSR